MKRGIVEGEPGIFPDPVARLLRAIHRWVTRRGGDDPSHDREADESTLGDDPPADGSGTG